MGWKWTWRCDTEAKNSGFFPRAHRRQLAILCNPYPSNALVPTGTVHTWSLDIHIWLNKIKKMKDDESHRSQWQTLDNYQAACAEVKLMCFCPRLHFFFLHFRAVIFHTICPQLLRRSPCDLCLLPRIRFLDKYLTLRPMKDYKIYAHSRSFKR